MLHMIEKEHQTNKRNVIENKNKKICDKVLYLFTFIKSFTVWNDNLM